MGRGLTSLNLQMSIFDKFDLNILRYFPLVGEYQNPGPVRMIQGWMSRFPY